MLKLLDVSNEFKKAVYAPERHCTARVTFEMIELEAQKNNAKVVTSESSISRKEQLTNGIRRATHKYATFEPNYFKLNGSFHIPPRNTEESNSEVGWWSEFLCDEQGVFTTPQVLTFTFMKNFSFGGINIIFDNLNDEYAEEFELKVIDDTGSIKIETITGNDLSQYQYFGSLDNIKEVSITIKKWCKGFRRGKVVEVSFGIIKTYDKDSLISLNLLKEMDPLSLTLPSDEIKFTIDNSSKEFNILSPGSVYKYLTKKQEIYAEIGVEVSEGTIEYLPMGKYYLQDWQSDEGALTATFTGRDIFDVLSNDDYKDSDLATASYQYNLYDETASILNKLNLPYRIDESLKNIKTQGYFPIMTYREALQIAAAAGGCGIYQNHKGEIVIKPIGLTTPEETTLDNMYSEPQIKLDNPVERVDVKINRLKKGQLKEFFNSELEVNGNYILYVQAPMWNGRSNFDPPIIKVEGAKTWTILKKSINEQVLKINAQGTVNIMISGYEIIKEVTLISIINPDVPVGKGTIVEVDNPLINTVDAAQALGERVMSILKNRANYEIDWRQNPSLECGDTILVENPFGSKRSIITKQVFDYDGALRGKSESRGES